MPVLSKEFLDIQATTECAWQEQEHDKNIQYHHDVYTEEVNEIALSSNDDKRLQTSDRITKNPYGTDEMMIKQS